MDIRFQTGHETKVKFSQGERSEAHTKMDVELSVACCDIGLLARPQVSDDKTP